MARESPVDFIDLDSTQESDDIDVGVGSESHYVSQSDGLHGSENSHGRDPEESKFADYDQVLKDYAEIKALKKKLKLSLNRLDNNNGFSQPKDAFSRLSVTGFSNVIDALTPGNRKVIEDYGFGALLMFDNCIVPYSFAKWVAYLVNYRSADIVFNGKVISLTRETVHLVLGLPLTDLPFPRDPSLGKSIVLSKFNKKSIPSVSFFANKLLQHEPMCDEDIFICFIIVAMNNFLCPNESDTLCYKYFGIFHDIKNAKTFDWCGYVLEWLIQGIKNFNSVKDGNTLAGCLYYLSVIYLDHVDFGARQVPKTIPRISVWKGSMIKNYSDFDLKSIGCYGCHPLIDSSQSCYSKGLRNLYNTKPFCLNPNFNDRLDKYAGCKLPDYLKVKICKLIEKYCLNSGLSFNMDIQCINALSDDMKVTFCNLLQHAYSVDSRSQKLVLNVIKLLFESTHEDQAISSESNATQQTANGKSHVHSNEQLNHVVLDDGSDPVMHETTHISVSELVSNMQEDHPSNVAINDNNVDDANGSLPLPVPNLNLSTLKSPSNVNNMDVATVVQKLNKRYSVNISSFEKTPSQSHIPPSANPHAGIMHCSKPGGPNVDKRRTPLDDLSNDMSSKRKKKSVSFSPHPRSHADVINLENENYYVPDTLSPVSIPGRRRFVPDKDILSLKKFTLSSQSSPTDTSDCANGTRPSQVQSPHSNLPTKVSPEVQFLEERTLAHSFSDMSKESDALYNSNFRSSQGIISTPIHVSTNNPSSSHPLSFNPAPSVAYKVRDSTSAGKLHTYVPRRLIQPGPTIKDVTISRKYHVSKSEFENYQRICSLAFSEYQGEDAVYLYGVRCTFWALGESLKPNGQVNSFVVSVFCYSLFVKPNGHPHLSKRYYFFSNIADNLLKNFDEADLDVLSRAFKRFSKSRPLTHSNMMFFPTFYDGHWFVFVVDIKDKKYVMLDSLFKKNDEYQQYVSHRMRASFEYHWKKFLQVDIGFEDFQLIYPTVPRQPSGHENDSGIYAMMFLEHWVSPSTSLSSLFAPKDIPNIRIKIANNLVFQPKNSGMKNRVIEWQLQDD
ncbi:unnamed protein product [Urochloa decumbens]|uniref:Ubiquitin-like protease family profile domain-containing protein n=1 Tax=Urochloa decumbens TaxID=240449 RepID=A0ABC8XJV8_9POAL